MIPCKLFRRNQTNVRIERKALDHWDLRSGIFLPEHIKADTSLAHFRSLISAWFGKDVSSTCVIIPEQSIPLFTK